MDATIILPTYNEADNIVEVMSRIHHTLEDCKHEIVVVDDGTDSTSRLAAKNGGVVVQGDRRGLSAAVVKGAQAAQSGIVVVMDADLQHPPELLTLMLCKTVYSDVVIGSRYVENGVIENWGMSRRVISQVSNMLSHPLAPKVHDRMTGYFATQRRYLTSSNLNPTGFKILLELLARNPHFSVCEVPIRFGVREHGQSKLTSSVGKDYLKQLWSLYLYRVRGAKWTR